jgi:hypothetical protein
MEIAMLKGRDATERVTIEMVLWNAGFCENVHLCPRHI